MNSEALQATLLAAVATDLLQEEVVVILPAKILSNAIQQTKIKNVFFIFFVCWIAFDRIRNLIVI